jgi:hypothetical protein
MGLASPPLLAKPAESPPQKKAGPWLTWPPLLAKPAESPPQRKAGPWLASPPPRAGPLPLTARYARHIDFYSGVFWVHGPLLGHRCSSATGPGVRCTHATGIMPRFAHILRALRFFLRLSGLPSSIYDLGEQRNEQKTPREKEDAENRNIPDEPSYVCFQLHPFSQAPFLAGIPLFHK